MPWAHADQVWIVRTCRLVTRRRSAQSLQGEEARQRVKVGGGMSGPSVRRSLPPSCGAIRWRANSHQANWKKPLGGSPGGRRTRWLSSKEKRCLFIDVARCCSKHSIAGRNAPVIGLGKGFTSAVAGMGIRISWFGQHGKSRCCLSSRSCPASTNERAKRFGE